MMKNRAGLLALLVLVIATILMVFFVLPRIGSDKKPIGDAINQASSQVGNIIADNTAKPADTPAKTADATAPAAEGAAKSAAPATAPSPAPVDIAVMIGALKDKATTSLAELKALFADGKGPTEDVFDAAKTKTINSLQAIVDVAKPDNADPVTATLIDKSHQGASKALAVIKALPENIADAVAAIDRARAVLLGDPTPLAQAPAAPLKPAFDVLRVEPDGSTVIAGRAAPGTKLDIIDGDKVINSTEVGPGGDFAAVLDNPLPAGDHEITLKSTGKDGTSVVSEETATVSIPKDGSSQLLAMVTKPGEASRIMTAPEAKQPRVTAPATKSAATPAPSAAPDATTAPATASVDPAATAADAGTPPATTDHAGLVISAVEVENDHLFVAGATRANLKVRAYADEKQIGESTAGGDGHFVIDGAMPLAVGDHKIRVDGLDASGKVIVRTAVNFNRPEGSQLTVAAQSPAAAAVNPAPAAALDEGQLGKLRSDLGRAFALLKGLFQGGQMPGNEQLAAARSGTEFALKGLRDFRPAIDASAALKQASSMASDGAGKALALLEPLPRDPVAVGAVIARLDQLIAPLLKPAAGSVAAAQAPSAATDPSDVKTYEQAPLAVNKNAVIIRQGDTLWQISRRTYGLGVRYTTIYLANEDKIHNPDRILPGQVFGLPKDALPNSEELHRQRLSGKHL
ncbi:LysM peptidoglycan-binding domain-containing protein [Rhizobium tumorigenes]|uniref:LysM peptidoglycan-binding domain-containing protein n=1 Tax=Rhizobium tumorigenes TaxID=2041385 RepID=UPI00241E5F1D|nr:LysM peptidoglycan-binding domain-containing protein [Rhizobium tumorigenes]WFS01839.1 LysM peptidoglycan-binding domain-containing protein [Rhizobium tumorigenes]